MTDTMRRVVGPPHWVYVLDCDHGVKVGIAVDLDRRLLDFERGMGFRPILLRSWLFDDHRRAYGIERSAHWFLREYRTTGEWFHCHPLEAVDAVEESLRAPLRYLVEKSRLAA